MTDRAENEQTAVLLTNGQPAPAWLAAWWTRTGLTVHEIGDPGAMVAMALRTRPRTIVLDARGPEDWQTAVLTTCRRLKRDSYTAIVPVILLVPRERFGDGFEAGADEVLRADVDDLEALARLASMIRRSDRDTDVHPSTRLPGTREIEAELARRVASGERFAACYADLDFFKEFNDRYGYHNGDQVIRLLARILHDVVKGLCGEHGFVGHIGGDDFLYTVDIAAMPRVCDEVIRVFDELIPLQYSEQDRRVGYFFGKDRRGQMHRVPLMTLSVGVVTNQRRRFTRAVEVSELATEMKSYAKTLPGSLWAVDRRRDEPATPVATNWGGDLFRDRNGLRSGGQGQ
ncbi:MAG: diguanylate cyclase [Gemmatimonas sp.]